MQSSFLDIVASFGCLPNQGDQTFAKHWANTILKHMLAKISTLSISVAGEISGENLNLIHL